MSSRKKPDPAVLRTIDIFTGKTPLETAEDLAREDESVEVRPDGPRDIVGEAEECAVRWLGLDAFHEGDDVKIVVHPSGHAVMMLVSTRGNAPYGTVTLKLSRAQWAKLKVLAREDS